MLKISTDRFSQGLPDPQEAPVACYCEGCGREIYEGIAMARYKRRGRTNQAMLMGDGDMPLPLTEEMALEAIRYWEARRSGKAR